MTRTADFTSLERAGRLAVAAGSLLVAAGTGAWFAVAKQLREEKITVPDNAPALAGRRVQGPASAYVQALVIKRNAERSADGRTFADISADMRSVDAGSDEAHQLRKLSASLSTAASLRSALMTSVLAFGVSALVAGLGSLFVLLGAQLRRSH